jgi:hypothetical protein
MKTFTNFSLEPSPSIESLEAERICLWGNTASGTLHLREDFIFIFDDWNFHLK